MSVTIEATPGHGAANSYVTVAEADAYHNASMTAAAWDEHDGDSRARALITATRQIDALRLCGDPLLSTQALHFPTVDDRYQTVGHEDFTADHDTAVQLDHTQIRSDSETVEDSGGTTYTRDDDYEIDYDDGTITALSSGEMTDAETFTICYGYTGIPQPVRNAACEQALHLLEQQAALDLIDRVALQAQGVRTIAVDGISETYGGPIGELCIAAQRLMRGYIQRTARILGRGAR